jgi:hypothetical protein
VTLQDLGVLKQAVSKRIRAMRSASPALTGPTIPAGAVLIDAAQIAISENLAIFYRAHTILGSMACSARVMSQDQA